MVRGTRVGAKQKLAEAQAEIDRLKAELANPQRTADAIVADSNTTGVNLVGVGNEPVQVTGGMTRKESEEKVFGKRWWVKVSETVLPFAKDVHRTAVWCRGGAKVTEFRANTEVLLSEAEINQLEESIIHDERPANIGMGSMELEKARALNTGYDLKQDKNGNWIFSKVMPRFHVQRLRPEQESITIS